MGKACEKFLGQFQFEWTPLLHHNQMPAGLLVLLSSPTLPQLHTTTHSIMQNGTACPSNIPEKDYVGENLMKKFQYKMKEIA